MSFFYTISLLFFSAVLLYIPFHLLLFSSGKRRSPSGEPLPPGRTGFPVIGESLEFLAACKQGRPDSFIWDRMNKYSPKLFKTHLFGATHAVFCGTTGNKLLFSNEDKLVRKWLPSSIKKICPSDPRSTPIDDAALLRKLFLGFLQNETRKNVVGKLDEVARRHFAEEWENKESVVVHPLAIHYAVSLVCRLALSVEDPKRVDVFAEHLKSFARGVFSFPIDFPGSRFRGAVNAAAGMRREILSIIKQRKIELAQGKASPRQDILSYMLSAGGEAEDNGGEAAVDELHIADVMLGVLIGSRDSTASTVCTILKYLAEYPEIYDRVYQEQMEIANSKGEGNEFLSWDDLQNMKYSYSVVCEALRICPPEQGTFRVAITDFSFNGCFIPKGWRLYWNAYSTHMDPNLFPEPQRFDPSRFEEGRGPPPFAYVPFGGGPRMCPGKEAARIATLIFVHNMVRRFKWRRLVPDEGSYVFLTLLPKKGLPLQLIPHGKAA